MNSAIIIIVSKLLYKYKPVLAHVLINKNKIQNFSFDVRLLLPFFFFNHIHNNEMK